MPGRDETSVLVAVLAAGRASRFGGGKLDADLGGKRVGTWVLDAVSEAGLAPGIVVCGPDAPAFVENREGWRCVTNPDPARGLGSSVSLAAKEGVAEGSDVLVLLADMPLVDPGHLRALIDSPGHAATLWPGGKPGVPAVIRYAALADFCHIDGDRGAGPLLARLEPLDLVACPPQSLLDIDRPEDLARVRHAIEKRMER